MIIQHLSPDLVRTRLKHIPRLLLLIGYLTLSLGSITLFHTQTASAAQRHSSNMIISAVSKSWYFADGRVGAGFQEYLTLTIPLLVRIAQPKSNICPKVRFPRPLVRPTPCWCKPSRLPTPAASPPRSTMTCISISSRTPVFCSPQW